MLSMLASSPQALAVGALELPKARLEQPTAEPFSDPPLLRGPAVAAEKKRTVPVKEAVQLETGNELADKAPIPRRPPRPPPRMKRRAR